MGNKDAVRVFVFRGDVIIRQQVSQLPDEVQDLVVPGHVGHGQVAGRALPTVRHPLGTEAK